MAIKKIGLVWISVSDYKKSEKFFVETLGLQLKNKDVEHGWLEVAGSEDGSILGIGQSQADDAWDPGINAIITFTVDDIEKTIDDLKNKGVTVGEIMEVPGHVKLATFTDNDGNQFQLAQEF